MTLISSHPPEPIRPQLRRHWMLDERIAFLNHGSFGAVPRVVFEEQSRWRERIEAEPVEFLGRRMAGLVAEAKQPVAALLKMREQDFGFVTNATEGINAVLRSLDLAAGDELLTTTHVYNAVRMAMRNVAERAGAGYREVDMPLPVRDGGEIVDRVMEAVGPRTKLVVVDHVTSPTAIVFPVERIAAECRARGVDVLIDGAHAPGMLPLDVPAIGATYYAANLHKWCCAPKGSAFLWVREDRQNGVHPVVVSHNFGKGLSKEFEWQGTRDVSAWLTIPAALKFMAELGWERIMSHNHAMAVWVQQMLCARWGVEATSPLSGEMLGSMASVPLPGKLARMEREGMERFQRGLYDQYRVEAPLMSWPGGLLVRPCCQVYNAPSEYERLADALSELATAPV